MPSLATAVLDIQQLDLLAYTDSPIHRLDARAKVLVTVIFCVTVISFGKYDLSALVPYCIFPFAMTARGHLPPLLIIRKIAVLCPFVLVIAAFNPLFDRTVVVHIGTMVITGGWLSFFSIVVRSLLTVSAALILVGVTGFTGICRALAKLGIPQAFAVQLLFLHRYVFVLADEGARASRAREVRSFGARGRGIGSYRSLIGYLLLRTWNRAERIHTAMVARGFKGEFQSRQESHFGRAELLHVVGWSTAFILMRCANGSRLVGDVLLGVLS